MKILQVVDIFRVTMMWAKLQKKENEIPFEMQCSKENITIEL